MTSSGSRRSAKMMAASTLRISAASMVTWAATSGFLQISIREYCLRTARYSGMYRPAWRMNQTGVRSVGCAFAARIKREVGADMNLAAVSALYLYQAGVSVTLGKLLLISVAGSAMEAAVWYY